MPEFDFFDDREFYAQQYNPPLSLASVPIINEYYPTISDEDINKGFITRYFSRQANHSQGEILEIDQKTYNRLKNNKLFKVISLEWKIKGPLDDVNGPPNLNSPTRLYTGVNTANRLITEQNNIEMPGLKYKLTNFSQFWTD